MALNVTTAVIGGGCQRAAASPSLAQWDRGQILKITGVDLPVTYNVEFCCQGDLTTTTMLGGADGVEIPNLLLQRGLPIIAYLVLHEGQDDRETEYWITIYVKQRAMPPSVTPDPEQAGIIDQLVAALNEGVTAAENAAAQAEAQVEHYPTVIDGTWHVWNALTESWVDTEVPATGPAGRGIISVTQNADYTLTLTFTDGTDWTTPTPVRGATGATPNLTIGTVMTGAAGSSAAASITGTAENPVLSLTIPQGLKGDPGNGDAIAPTFSASTAYPAGAYVIYNGSLYRFTAAHAAGAWVGTDAVAAVLGNDVAELKGELNSIATTTNPANLFPFTQQSVVYKSIEDLTVAYPGDDAVNLSFTSVANPIIYWKVENLFAGKQYKVSFDVTSGSINENFWFVRKYLSTSVQSGEQIAGIPFTNHHGEVVFTVPTGENCVVIGGNMVYNSKNVTFSNVNVVAVGDVSKTFIKSTAENPNNIHASFIYSTVTGDCTILKILGDESAKTMMIDTMADNNTVAKNNILSALNRDEITHLDYLMISHYHSDHIGNIQWLIDNGYIDEDTIFILPEDVDSTSAGLIRDDNPDKVVVQACEDVLAIITSLGAEKVYPTENQVITVNDCDFVFWNTDHSEYYALNWVDYNECSLCCTMIYGGMVMQFTGDIGTRACGNYYDKLYKCNIFKANHHACGYAVVPRFMSAVFPEIVITMAGSGVIYSTDPAVQAVFATLNNGLQAWCETEFVPNYVTGVIQSNIYLTINKNSFKFDSDARRCIRADEGIPVSS